MKAFGDYHMQWVVLDGPVAVDMTAAAEAATQASVEIALAVTAVTSARLRLLRLEPRWNSRKQQRTLSPVREGAVIIEDALYIK